MTFTEEQKKEIASLIEQVERQTGSEIVPYIVEQSDGYQIAFWKALAIFSVTALVTILVGHMFFADLFLEIIVMFLYVLVGGFAAVFVPSIRKMFISRTYMAVQVERRALLAFLQEEVFKTRKRNGILIFISVYEQMIEVIGDTNINKSVSREEWDGVIKGVSEYLKRDDFQRAILNGISLCGDLLVKNGFTKRQDDVNELPNELRLGR